MKREKIVSFLAALLFLFGVCTVLYPSVSNWVNERNASKVVTHYDDAVTELAEDEYAEVLNVAIEHNKAIAEQGFLAAALDMENKDELQTYNSVLNPAGDGVMGMIRIPKIHVKLPIYHTTEDAVIQEAAGHYVGSSLPVGGENTHAILSSHRGLPSARLFTDLDQMKIGDMFYIDVLDETLAYQVDDIDTIEPKANEKLNVQPGKDYVTLVTCTPYGVNTHRLLVRGTRVPYVPEIEKAEEEKAHANLRTEMGRRIIFLIIFSIGIFGIAIFAGIKLGDKFRTHENMEEKELHHSHHLHKKHRKKE